MLILQAMWLGLAGCRDVSYLWAMIRLNDDVAHVYGWVTTAPGG